MTTNILPVSNIINVTISNTPTGLPLPNINNVALFTQDAPINGEVYGTYVNSTQVASNYGTNSVTAQMADALFAQVPNPLSGGGQLVVIPLEGTVSATPGYVTTANINANIATIAAVDDGDLKVTIDGTANNLTGLDFTGVTTMAEIAAVIQAKLQNCIVTSTTNTIIFTSKKVGTGSSIALASYSGGGTDLTGASYLNTASAVTTAATNSSGETILEAIDRTSGLVFYCPIMTTAYLEDSAISTIAAGVQSLNNLFFHQCASTGDIAGIATTISSASETKTRLLLYTESQAAGNLMKAAYVGRGCSQQLEGSNTSTTMMLKSLATITPDNGISQTFYEAAKTAGIDCYVSWGVPGVLSTGGNDYFDNQYANLAMLFAFQTAGFNYLAGTNTKVPQTEQGMNGLKSAYAKVCVQFVNNGELAPGTWNSSLTFGDPATFNNNIEKNGYYIYSLPVAQQSAEARNAREAPLVQIALKRAGAIHTSDVLVFVNA